MGFYDILRRSLRSLKSAKARTVLTALAIAVGTFALTLTLAARNGAQTYADNIVKNNFDPTELIVTKDGNLFSARDNTKPQVYNQSFGTVTSANGTSTQVQMLNDSDIVRLGHISGVSSAIPAITLNLQYLTRDGQKKYVATMQTYNSYQNPTLLAGTIPSNIPPKSVILPEGFLSALGFNKAQSAIGQNVRLAVQNQATQKDSIASLLNGTTSSASSLLSSQINNEENFKVIAVYKTPSTLIQASTGLYLYANNNEVIRLNDFATSGTANFHKYLSAYVKVTNGKVTANLNQTQRNIEKAGYSAQSILDTEKTITQVISVLQGIVIVFGAIAIIASIFGVINTMYISVLQRTREIGLMKALGMHKKDISKLFRYEAALIGFLGGLIGSVVAIVLGISLNPFISSKLSLGDTRLLQFKFSQITLLIIALVLVTIAAGILPARKAAKLDPIEALRTE